MPLRQGLNYLPLRRKSEKIMNIKSKVHGLVPRPCPMVDSCFYYYYYYYFLYFWLVLIISQCAYPKQEMNILCSKTHSKIE